ncbi:hypothetical protein [Streptomyces sp. A1-5]|uniref:hypothetical protein n=1 Tax=Streptomyces sp. A1-5 TaxID=2738410 RepID=UPI003FA788E9
MDRLGRVREIAEALVQGAEESSMRQPDPRYAARLAAYGAVATRLPLLSDRRIGAMAADAAPLGSGVGGGSAELDLDGTRVFVKRVPLTDTADRCTSRTSDSP